MTTRRDQILADIKDTVDRRARHEVLDDVTKTLSDWNVADIVAGEYHGRFLIELLQNARDAFLEVPDAKDGVVRVRLTSEPALVVANQGAPLTTKVLLQSIGRFGLGTKTKGLSIGHKGIGFKSVLEVSMTPEIYSARSADGFDMAVCFDPARAAARVREASPRWDELVRESPARDDPQAAEHVPALLFPFVVDDVDGRLHGADEFESGRFDTVIRLPRDQRFDDALGLSRGDFVDRVRAAMAGVTDQIVVLLAAFGTLYLEDEEAGTSHCITRRVVQSTPLDTRTTCREVVIEHDGVEHSRWLAFERVLPDKEGLEGSIVAAARIERDPAGRAVLRGPSLAPGDGGDCLHLFFPTTIPSRLPFLLHAYFRVDAGRKAFADADAATNRALLGELATLVVDSLRHLLAGDDLDADDLPELFARSDGSVLELLVASREQLLAGLDTVPWVPVVPVGAGADRAEPTRLVIERDEMIASELPAAVPAPHLASRLGLFYPDGRLSRGALDFVARRAALARSGDAGLTPAMLVELLAAREGDAEPVIWPPEAADIDAGFLSLLSVLTSMRAAKPNRAAFLDDPDVAGTLAFVPVVSAGPSGRHLRQPVPGKQRGASWILARTVATGEQAAPPDALAIDFLPDGMLADEGQVRGAHFLGIREYRTDFVLDAITPTALGHARSAAIAPFMWRFLGQDGSPASTLDDVLAAMAAYEPGQWHWSAPGAPDSKRDGILRESMLARILLPAADGSLVPADDLVFGGAWAAWCDEAAVRIGHRAYGERATAYRDLEHLAPPSGLLAGPEALLDFLNVPQERRDDDATASAHAFAVRLGVWEIPPIEALNTRTSRGDDDLDPWHLSVPGREAHRAWVREHTPAFERAHQRVHIGEDYALRWPPTGRPAHLAALARGARFYERHFRQIAYCPGPSCKGSGTHRNKAWDTDAAERASYLRWQLERSAWVPVAYDRARHTETVIPADAWRDESGGIAGTGAGSARFLRVATGDVPAALASAVGVGRVESASVERVGRLLRWLHEMQPLLLGDEDRPTSEAGRAFMSLHRRAYDRLLELGGDSGLDATRDTGVLATRRGRLLFVDRREARLDRGNFTLYRRLFEADIPFLAVKSDRVAVATTLGVHAFEVKVEPLDPDRGEDVTSEADEILGQRAPLFLAALVHYAVAGTTIDIENDSFRDRARRLAGLTVRRVKDLALRVWVPDSPWEQTTGLGKSGEIYVEGPLKAEPVIFHDYPGEDWLPRFRSDLAPHLASILESDAYVSVFRLLLEADDDEAARGILAGFGVTSQQIAEVATAIGAADRVARDDEARWWAALLPLLGAAPAGSPRDQGWRETLRASVSAARPDLADPELSIVVDSGRTDGARQDIREDGVLALLESRGVVLRDLHAALVETGDRGLQVRGGGRRLEKWLRAHGDEVRAVLAVTARAGAHEPRQTWEIPPDDDWHAVAPPEMWLAPVITDLEAATGHRPDAQELAGADAAVALARLVNMTPAELRERWIGVDPAAAARLARQQADAWGQILESVVVAASLEPVALSRDIRARALEVREALDLAESPPEAAELLGSLVPRQPKVAAALAELVRGHLGISLPTVDAVAAIAIDAGLDAGFVAEVRRVLRMEAPAAADRIRRDVGALVAAGIAPVEVHPDTPPPPPPPPPEGRIKVPLVKHHGADTAAIGRAGERWALAAVMRAMLDLPREQRRVAADAIAAAIGERFTDAGVGRIRRLAEEVSKAADEDAEVEALARLVHVSEISDAFGFDIAGYLPDEQGGHRVLLIEVKATGDRGFVVSRHEWEDVATRDGIRGSYAFMTVARTKANQPRSIELVVNPADLHERGLLRLDVRDWQARYRPSTSAERPAGATQR